MMDWKILLRAGWKLFAIISIPIVIIAVIIIFNVSNGTNSEKFQIENSELSTTFASNLWPEGRVPYTIEPYMDDAKVLIKNVMMVFQRKTCIKFEDTRKSDTKWLSFVRNDEICADSVLGMDRTKKGEDKIQFGLDCLTDSTIQRSIARSLGLDYEESRPDRDKYIEYKEGCRDSNNHKNLSLISQKHNEAALEIFFDYTSHMFSDAKCLRAISPWSVSNEITVGSSEETQPGTLSVLDIEKLNAIYNCPDCNSYRFRPVNRLTDSAYSFESFNPVHAGNDVDGIPFYICRVLHIGSILIGKLKVTHEEHRCWIADGGKEYRYGRKYEILTNPKHVNLTWIPQVGTSIPTNAVLGGRTAHGQTIHIGRCSLQSGEETSIIPSSIIPGIRGLKVPFSYGAYQCSSYEILVCNE